MENFPRLETDRLVLSELHADDIADIVRHASNKNVSQYTINIPSPYAEKDAIYWVNSANLGFRNRTQYIFAIRLKEQDTFIGGIGITVEPRDLRAEIGYWLAEPLWNKGFMSEATKSIMEFGFTRLGLNRISANHLGINEASGKVMLKCGMIKEGEMKEYVFKNGVFYNLVVYGLTKAAYEKRWVGKNE